MESYCLTSTDRVKELCNKRIDFLHVRAVNQERAAVEAARHVWWRKVVGLPPLSEEKARARLMHTEGELSLGNILQEIKLSLSWSLKYPENLLNLCDMAEGGVVLLSSVDAERLSSWE